MKNPQKKSKKPLQSSKKVIGKGATTTLFSTQILHTRLLTSPTVLRRLLRELESDSHQLFQGDSKGKKWSLENYKNGYTSYGSLDRVDLMTESFLRLRKSIDRHVQNYVSALHYDCNPSDLTMTQCWVNVMFDNTYHSAHIHPNAVISGTFYVNVPKGASPIQFEDPRLTSFMNCPNVKASAPPESQRFYKVYTKPGDLVLFESWLRHEVPMGDKALKDNPRISISFNYGLK